MTRCMFSTVEVSMNDTTNVKSGRILKVKLGYNPNSSSIGSAIYAFSATILPAAALFGIISGAIYSAFAGKRRDMETSSDNPES